MGHLWTKIDCYKDPASWKVSIPSICAGRSTCVLNTMDSIHQYWYELAEPRLMEIYLIAWSFPQATSQQFLDTNLRSESNALLALQPTLRTTLNSLAPVERLPPEMLSYCFLLLRSEEVERLIDADSYRSDSTGIQWLMAITHVCRRWRTVALDAQPLWRQLDVRSGSEWSQAMLSRAGTLPLVIVCNGLDIENCVGWIQDDVVPNMDRVEEIRLCCLVYDPNALDYSDYLVELCAHTAPMLKSFHFALFQDPDEEQFQDIYMDLPKPLFGGAAPLLSKITLSGLVEFHPPSSSSFRNLTSLFLSAAVETNFRGDILRDEDIMLASHRQALINFNDLLDALEQSPSLQDLTVISCLSNVGSDVGHNGNVTRVVRLPHMRNIILWENISECARLMRHIYLPPTSLRSITARVEWDILDDEALLKDVVRTLILHDGMQGRMRAVSIELECKYKSEETRVHLKHWLQPPLNRPGVFDDWEIQLPKTVPDMKITLAGPAGMEHELHVIINALTRGTDFSAVETFSVYYDAGSRCLEEPSKISVDWWLDNLTQMRRLSRIALSERLGNIFIEVLSRSGMSGEDMYHPHLSHVALSQVDFDECLFGEQTAYDTLYSALASRSSAGRPLQWLLLEDCTIPKRWVQELSEVVDDVLWDDNRGSHDNEDEGNTSDSDQWQGSLEDEDEGDSSDIDGGDDDRGRPQDGDEGDINDKNNEDENEDDGRDVHC